MNCHPQWPTEVKLNYWTFQNQESCLVRLSVINCWCYPKASTPPGPDLFPLLELYTHLVSEIRWELDSVFGESKTIRYYYYWAIFTSTWSIRQNIERCSKHYGSIPTIINYRWQETIAKRADHGIVEGWGWKMRYLGASRKSELGGGSIDEPNEQAWPSLFPPGVRAEAAGNNGWSPAGQWARAHQGMKMGMKDEQGRILHQYKKRPSESEN